MRIALAHSTANTAISKMNLANLSVNGAKKWKSAMTQRVSSDSQLTDTGKTSIYINVDMSSIF